MTPAKVSERRGNSLRFACGLLRGCPVLVRDGDPSRVALRVCGSAVDGRLRRPLLMSIDHRFARRGTLLLSSSVPTRPARPAGAVGPRRPAVDSAAPRWTGPCSTAVSRSSAEGWTRSRAAQAPTRRLRRPPRTSRPGLGLGVELNGVCLQYVFSSADIQQHSQGETLVDS